MARKSNTELIKIEQNQEEEVMEDNMNRELELQLADKDISDITEDTMVLPQEETTQVEESKSKQETVQPEEPNPRQRRRRSILTIDQNSDTANQMNPEEQSWHEIQSSVRAGRVLSGQLSGIEKTENNSYIAVVYYKEIRVIIPLSEMMIELNTGTQYSYGELEIRQVQIVYNMLGCDIDFIVKGTDNKSRSAVASRKEAMYRKRQTFYLTPDQSGLPKIYEGGIAEARVLAVSEKVIRVELFGVETSIPARELTWEWCGDARERFNVGDEIKVKITNVSITPKEEGQPLIQLNASVKQAIKDTVAENLSKCKVQSTYAGVITNIAQGTIYIRLHTGVNAIAFRCNDRRRLPAKNDYVSFVVTRVDIEKRLALGLITKIIKQHI